MAPLGISGDRPGTKHQEAIPSVRCPLSSAVGAMTRMTCYSQAFDLYFKKVGFGFASIFAILSAERAGGDGGRSSLLMLGRGESITSVNGTIGGTSARWRTGGRGRRTFTVNVGQGSGESITSVNGTIGGTSARWRELPGPEEVNFEPCELGPE